jgi:hypothetical protein
MTTPDPLADEELDQLDELALVATPGPWHVHLLDDEDVERPTPAWHGPGGTPPKPPIPVKGRLPRRALPKGGQNVERGTPRLRVVLEGGVEVLGACGLAEVPQQRQLLGKAAE